MQEHAGLVIRMNSLHSHVSSHVPQLLISKVFPLLSSARLVTIIEESHAEVVWECRSL